MGRYGVGAAVASVACILASLFASPAAGAQNLTQAESEFLDAVVPQGYGRNYETVQAGYSVCSLLDKGMGYEGIGRFIIDSFGDARESNTFYASLFAQYATYSLCPRHIDKYGPI